jgi:hypothetical protein
LGFPGIDYLRRLCYRSFMKIDTVVTLNNGEQAICLMIAKMRYEECRRREITNAKVGDQSNEETDLEGFASEMAFGKIFNIYPDFLIQPKKAQFGEDDGDFVLPSRKRVDVKSTKHKDGRLICVPWKEHTCDYYCLMVGEFPTYTFKGFITHGELFKPYRYINLGKMYTYAANQYDLMELDEIEDAIRMKRVVI